MDLELNFLARARIQCDSLDCIFFRVLKQMWKKGAANDEGYFKLTSAYSQELLLTATSAKLLEVKGKTLSTLTGKKIYKKNKCLHYSSLPTSTCIWLQVKIFFAITYLRTDQI